MVVVVVFFRKEWRLGGSPAVAAYVSFLWLGLVVFVWSGCSSEALEAHASPGWIGLEVMCGWRCGGQCVGRLGRVAIRER